ncbi:hypothetical protein HN937_17960 [Candidatus Poribacteria bacterium]|nr:hypothetical protein [Candidatus Poribacteria bacterium]
MMREPGELELLILPYLSDELDDADCQRVELQIATEPEFAKLVEEFRTTLSFFEGEDEAAEEPEIGLDNVLDDLYREVAARDARGARSPWRKYAPAPIARLVVPVWATAGAVAACLFLSVAGFRYVTAPIAFSPVAEMTPTADRPESADVRRQDYIAVQIIERLDEAQLIQHVRGDSVAALSLYDDILRDEPDAWARTVADAGRAEILRTTALPMNGYAAQPVFLEVAQP